MEYLKSALTTLMSFFMWFKPLLLPRLRWSLRYLLSDDQEYDETMTRVPDTAIYIEEYSDNGVVKSRVTYGGADIHSNYTEDPFDSVIVPWIWIGDKTSETDITNVMQRFLVPNNVIRLELIHKFIHKNIDTKIVYLDSSLEEHEFPSDGITIAGSE